jgi:hypothetical protein
VTPGCRLAQADSYNVAVCAFSTSEQRFKTWLATPGRKQPHFVDECAMRARLCSLAISDLIPHTQHVGVVLCAMGREVCLIAVAPGQVLCWRASLVAPASS